MTITIDAKEYVRLKLVEEAARNLVANMENVRIWAVIQTACQDTLKLHEALQEPTRGTRDTEAAQSEPPSSRS